MDSSGLCFFFFVSCQKKETSNDEQTLIAFNILATFESNESFQLNNTVVIHHELFLQKKSSKDTLWIPSSIIVYDQKGDKKFRQKMSNTFLIRNLGQKLRQFEICRIQDIKSASLKGWLILLGEVQFSSTNEYKTKIRLVKQ